MNSSSAQAGAAPRGLLVPLVRQQRVDIHCAMAQCQHGELGVSRGQLQSHGCSELSKPTAQTAYKMQVEDLESLRPVI